MIKDSRLDHVDLLRGLASLLVLAGHLRGFIFQSNADLLRDGAQLGALVKFFYFTTGLGHQAVMIFFAMSGFLVGGKALSDMLSQNFIWSRYLLRRLTRLWLVIVPTLLLTLLFDRIGLSLTNGIGYDGRYYELFASGPRSLADLDHSIPAMLGNLAFLQTIYVPPFGSNGPMWSLANEFWYYIVFPLAAWLLLTRASVAGRVTGSFVLVALVIVLPFWLLEGGIIWSAGAAAAWCSRRLCLTGLFRSNVTRAGAIALLVTGLIVSKVPALNIGDLGLGLIVALALPILAHLPSLGGAYSKAARALSEISYSLYLTHFPFLTMIVLTSIAPIKWLPSIAGVAVYMGLMIAAITWAAIVWWCFERNTDRIYAGIALRIPSRATVI